MGSRVSMVLIGHLPAAFLSDMCTCIEPPKGCATL